MGVAPHTLRTAAEVEEAVGFLLLNRKAFAFDVEARGDRPLLPADNEVFFISFASEGYAFTLPIGHHLGKVLQPPTKRREPWWDSENPTATGRPRKRWATVHYPAVNAAPPAHLGDEVWELLTPLFQSGLTKVGHNLKFDLTSVATHLGFLPPGPYFDTMIAAKLAGSPTGKLKDLTKTILKFTYEDIGRDVWLHSYNDVARYVSHDARSTWLLFRHFRAIEEKYPDLWQLEMDLLPVLANMELVGTIIDTGALKRFEQEQQERLEASKRKLFDYAGREFNPNANLDKQWFVYDHLGHAVEETTGKGAPSVNQGALRIPARKDPAVRELLEYARIKKMLSTYTDSLYSLLREGRVHANFRQVGTDTGRLSCSDPNLQNIPRRGEEGKLIRAMFMAQPGHKYVVADYSQIELRVLAHFSKDATLLRVFEEDGDPHTATAALLFNTTEDKVKPQERDIGKTTNFLIAYGGGYKKLAVQANISEARAKKVIDQHRKEFPRIYTLKDDVIKMARKRKPPYVKTVTGRRRYLPELVSAEDMLRFRAERQAFNTLIQGTAADIIKQAMVDLDKALPEDCTLLLSVHDELVVEAPEEVAPDIGKLMSEVMEAVDLIDVRLVAEANVGNNWNEAK